VSLGSMTWSVSLINLHDTQQLINDATSLDRRDWGHVGGPVWELESGMSIDRRLACLPYSVWLVALPVARE
jgi:hypothetical protein